MDQRTASLITVTLALTSLLTPILFSAIAFKLMKVFATREDLAKFEAATREDLAKFEAAVKEDIGKIETHIESADNRILTLLQRTAHLRTPESG